jgi:hypothetical protein
MKQLNIDPALQLAMPDQAPIAAQILKPLLFKDGDVYCCLLGADAIKGIFGCGDSPVDAVEDWVDTLRDRVDADDQDDEVVKEVLRILTKHREKLSAESEKEFMKQFRPGKSKNAYRK